MSTDATVPEPGDQLPDERPQRRREYSGAASTLGVAAAVILVVGALIWWFEFRGDDAVTTAADGTGIVALPDEQNPTGRAAAAEPGRAAPNFRLATLDGTQVELTDYRGKWVLLNFWASWCPPCRSETPDIQALSTRAGNEMVVLGVNLQESRAAAADFAEKYGLTYPIVLDRSGEVSIAYRVGNNIPATLLVRPDGVIEQFHIGELSSDALAEIEAGYRR